eukprot:6192425-Pleurochrysis_carterae.AAC.1
MPLIAAANKRAWVRVIPHLQVHLRAALRTLAAYTKLGPTDAHPYSRTLGSQEKCTVFAVASVHASLARRLNFVHLDEEGGSAARQRSVI